MPKVLYRYESLTSELKVWAERSPLSAWTEVAIVKKLRFQLVFNRSKPLVIAGNQDHLANLISGIADYVNRLLNPQVNLESNNLEVEQNLGIKLFHQFSIPQLQEFHSREFSTLELFDLLTNLELFTTEVEILPNLDSSLNLQIPWINSGWLKVAAAAIATVGITTGIRVLQPESPQYVVTSSSVESTSETRETLKPKQQPIKPENSDNLATKLNEPNSNSNFETAKNNSLIPNLKQNSLIPTDTLANNSIVGQNNISQSSKPQLPEPKFVAPEIAKPSENKSQRQLQISPNPSENPSSPIPSDSPKPVVPAPSVSDNQTVIPPSNLRLNDGVINEAPTSEIQRNQTEEQPSSSATFPSSLRRSIGNINPRSDRTSTNESAQVQNLKLEVIKIDDSDQKIDFKNLELLKQKIEEINLSLPKSAPVINEIKIQIDWQNYEIIEFKIVPDISELNELKNSIKRSLLEVISKENELDDGKLEIRLKLVKN